MRPSKTLAVFLAAAVLGACASSRNLGDSLSDLGANAEMKGILLTDRQFDYSDIDLTVYEGRLMLTGSMRSEKGRKKLIDNAWKADGVDEVIDEIFVGDKTPLGQGLEDTRIDQSIRTKLISDRGVTSGNYKMAVSGAVVYLIGAARDEDELNRALYVARTTAGVEKVVSHVVFRAEPVIYQR